MRLLETDTLSNQNIVNPLSVATFTASQSGELFAEVYLNQITGNGDYKIWLTKQRLGAGDIFKSAVTTISMSSGSTSMYASTILVPVSSGDVVQAYVQGLAADTTTPDITTDWWYLATWDEVLTGATHNIAGSSGRRLRQIASNIIIDGTVVSSTNNTVVLDAGASAVSGSYDPSIITVVDPVTGMAQARMILDYVGASKTATIDRNWRINPDNTYTYTIVAHPGREHVNEGKPQAVAAGTITLNANASSIDNAYNGQLIFIRSGTGEDQVKIITAYNGTTKVATLDEDWDTMPDTSSGYVILPSQFGHVTTSHFNGTSLQQMFTDDTGLTYSNAVDGSVIKEVLDGVPPSSVGAAAIWAYASRTLTQTLAQIINAVTGANQISLYRGDTNEINLVIGDISDYLNLDFVIKNDYEDNDDQSILWVRKNITGSADGLLSLYDYAQIGGVADPTWANIVINDASTGDILITVKADASQYLKDDTELFWDVHKITATKRKTLKNGLAEVDPDVGNAII